MSWPHILVGAATLLFGRRLFWLFVGGTGFAAGAFVAVQWIHPATPAGTVLIGAVAGLAGALLARFAQKVAVTIAGFVAGAYLGLHLQSALQAPWPPIVVFLAGGVVGALLLSLLFDWALVAFSALVGAVLVVVGVGTALPPPWPPVLGLALLVAGLAFQSRILRGKPAPPPAKPANGGS